MNLILLDAHDVGADGRVRLDDVRGAHIARVLRAVPGQTVRIGLVDGPLGEGVVTAVDNGVVELACTFAEAVPARPRVDLLLALPRPKVMRRLWAQIAALGVGRILLTNAERVERNYFDTDVLDPAKYRPRLLEGLQQARDTRVPEVSIHRQLKVLVEDHLDGLFAGVRLVADPAAGATVAGALADALTPADASRSRADATGGRVLLAAGPEGGWTPYELRMFARHGFVAATMGPRTLRTDTACLALLALAHAAPRVVTPEQHDPR